MSFFSNAISFVFKFYKKLKESIPRQMIEGYRIPFAKEITHKEGKSPCIPLSSSSKEKNVS